MEVTPKKIELSQLKQVEIGEIVAVRGLLSSIEYGMTKTSTPFVRGHIRKKDIIVEFKKWETSKMAWDSMIDKDTVVEMVGQVDLYQGIPQIICMNIYNVSDTVEQYAITTMYNPVDMYNNVCSTIKMYVSTGWLQNLLLSVMEEHKSRLMYYPLSDTEHIERGGYMNWLYRTMGPVVARSTYGVEKRPSDGINVPDCEVAIAGLILGKLGNFNIYNVNAASGEVVETDYLLKTIEGNTYNSRIAETYLDKAKETIMQNSKNIENYNTFINEQAKKIVRIRHCVLSLNGLVQPALLEARIVASASDSEIKDYEFFRIQRNLNNGETAVFNRINTDHLIIGL